MYSKLAQYIKQLEGDQSIAYNKYAIQPSQVEYGQLGDVVFVVSDGLESLSESGGYNYAQHDIITGKPILQAMGDNLTEYQLRIVMYRFLGNDVSESIQLLKTLLGSGEPQPLVFVKDEDLSYLYQGNYVVTDVRTDIISTNPNGIVDVAKVSMSLKEYVDRKVLEVKKIAKKKKKRRPKKKKITQKKYEIVRAEGPITPDGQYPYPYLPIRK